VSGSQLTSVFSKVFNINSGHLSNSSSPLISDTEEDQQSSSLFIKGLQMFVVSVAMMSCSCVNFLGKVGQRHSMSTYRFWTVLEA
jgi:hypothetical protein